MNAAGWPAAGEGGLTLARTVRGVAERHTLDATALRSAEARWLDERHERLAARLRRRPHDADDGRA